MHLHHWIHKYNSHFILNNSQYVQSMPLEKMLHAFSFPSSNHASTTAFPASPLLLNTKSFHISNKSPTFPFSCKPFNTPAPRSVLRPVSANASLQHLDIKRCILFFLIALVCASLFIVVVFSTYY